jgi:hypothetical protein
MKIVFSVLCALSLMAVSCTDSEISGCTNTKSFNYDPIATRDDGKCLDMEGCVGYQSDLNQSGKVITSFNDAYHDQKFSEEVSIQRAFFNGIPAKVFGLLEPSVDQKNAYATSDGKILFGYYMLKETTKKYGELPIAGILAHEWGHRTQFVMNWQDYGQPAHRELEADAFSGFYMALAKQWAWSKINSYFQSVFDNGDSNFNSPIHHGTSQERLAAAKLGVDMGLAVLRSGKQMTYSELHNSFISKIKTVIKPRSSSTTYAEIEYPKGLTQEFVQSLFPTK